MSQDHAQPIQLHCPHCEAHGIETAVEVPYVRGVIIVLIHGSKLFVGCVRCVRIKVLGEVGLSCLLGWFSLFSILINPFLILYNLIRLSFIGIDYAKAQEVLREAGIPQDQTGIDVTRLCYSLAASMIIADGRIDANEVAVAKEVGGSLLSDFDEFEFDGVVANAMELPPPEDIATLLNETLDQEQKKAVIQYLWMIAWAAGYIDAQEKQLLVNNASNMRFDLTALEASNEM